jgi:hypothetical protein
MARDTFKPNEVPEHLREFFEEVPGGVVAYNDHPT